MCKVCSSLVLSLAYELGSVDQLPVAGMKGWQQQSEAEYAHLLGCRHPRMLGNIRLRVLIIYVSHV